MFRSKVFSILQTTVKKNSYNSSCNNMRMLFSSNTSKKNSTRDSTLDESSTKDSILNTNSSNAYAKKNIVDIVKEWTAVNNEPPANALSSETRTLDKLYKKIEVEIRGNDVAVLRSYITFCVMAAKHLEIEVGDISLPKKPILERYTVLKSVHVHKKHRVQYEIRTYYRTFDVKKLTGSTADTYLEYIQRNLPEGVAMKVTKEELNVLPEAIRKAIRNNSKIQDNNK